MKIGDEFWSGRRRYLVHGFAITASGLEVASIEDITIKNSRNRPFPWPRWIIERATNPGDAEAQEGET